MKKILALVLALMMVLTAVAVLAEESKTNEDIADVATDNADISAAIAEDDAATTAVKATISSAVEGGKLQIEKLPEEVASVIPEGFTKVNDMETIQLEGDVSGLDKLTLNIKFETPYTKGEEIFMILVITKEDGTVEWVTVNGVASEDGNVVVVLDEALLAAIGNNKFVAVPVSK